MPIWRATTCPACCGRMASRWPEQGLRMCHPTGTYPAAEYFAAAIPPPWCAPYMRPKFSKGSGRNAMTPQERKLIDELFDRLASLERNPRDPDAVRAINEGLQRAPNALYPLVQTTLVQDEALKRADARIRALEDELELEPGEPGGSNLSGSDLARDAGVNDIGRGGQTADADDSSQRAGLFDSPPGDSDFDGGEIDVGGDFGGDGGSDSA